ncbi:MAG: hypothetical protein JJ879_13810 [Sneathiella sp.]|nr:hypothetical protein [Sneathiella sp.]
MLKISILNILYGPNHLSDYDFIRGLVTLSPPKNLDDDQLYLTHLQECLTTELNQPQEVSSPIEAFMELMRHIKEACPASLIKALRWNTETDRQNTVAFEIESRSRDLVYQLLNLLHRQLNKDIAPKELGKNIHSACDTIYTSSCLNDLNDLLLDSADRLKIPYMTLNTNGPAFILGHGKGRQLMWRSLPNRVGILSDKFTHDKFQTQTMLKKFGFPNPGTRIIRNERDLQTAATNPGFPMVLKPLDGMQGKGISLNIKNLKEAITAFRRAQTINRTVLAERYIPGHDVRIMILNGKATHAVSRRIPTVIGDGIHSITELMEIENKTNPLRIVASYSHNPFVESDFQKSILAMRGLTHDYIPAKREVIELHNAPNIKRGGHCLNVMDQIHPANLRLAEETAALFDMDFAGIDLVSPDCTRPYWENDGIVVEVNSMPHLRPICAVDQENYKQVVDTFVSAIMSPPQSSPTQLTVIAGGTEPSVLAGSLYQSLLEQEIRAGLFTDDAAIANGFRLSPKTSRRDQINALLFNPHLDHILIAEDLSLIHHHGLGYRYIDNLWIEELPTSGAEMQSLQLLVQHTQKQVIIPPGRNDIREMVSKETTQLRIEENTQN